MINQYFTLILSIFVNYFTEVRIQTAYYLFIKLYYGVEKICKKLSEFKGIMISK